MERDDRRPRPEDRPPAPALHRPGAARLCAGRPEVATGLLAIVALAAAAPEAGERSLAFPVTSDTAVHERRISRRLVLRVRRWPHREDGVAGWEVEVEDVRRPSAGNLLYHSRSWHGPYPTQVAAHNIRTGYFPDTRRLPVQGHRWEVAIQCDGCAAEGEGLDARFTRGDLRVRWQRR